ncbi:RNA polymerase sigma-70 factor [Pseudoflavitalea sp. X16]|uniref:RNA polymerase sigma factor n=1 Tax=Paraflavitalea devenefica TaxID=2716334 RepID=UPI00141FA7A0|nr:RNA polymerase sigma-70 factor [Paraflavitalea devenefica]NII28116.1 RNA polymerase sigma-70 factor [Paraflavitalea devenefica]
MITDYRSLTDADLFQLLKQDDMQAFEEIYERYFIRLLNSSYKRIHSREDALEMVQDIFVQLYLKRTQVGHTWNLPGYLQMMLKNKIIDRFREQLSRKRHYHYLQQAQPVAVQETPEANMDGKLLEEKIRAVIEQLPEKSREVFILSRANNLSHQAIAERMNISVSTVEKHIGKVLKMLRQEVAGFHINSWLLICYSLFKTTCLFMPHYKLPATF